MERLKLINTEREISNKDIDELEQMLNAKLPNSFIHFYKMNNGGSTGKMKYSFGEELIYPCHYFYSIKFGEKNIKVIMDLIKNKGIPCMNMLPFAYNHSNQYYLLSLNPDTYGQIFVWESNHCLSSGGQLVYHCASFEKMLEGMSMSFTTIKKI